MRYSSTYAGRFRRMIGISAMAAIMALTGESSAHPARPASEPFIPLLRGFLDAERDFDQAGIAARITQDYVEVSPIGEVDERERMLGFYALANKRAAPAIALDEVTTQVVRDAATVTARLGYSVPGPDGQVRMIAMRGGFVFRRERGDWKIAFAQYTPIRPSKSGR